MQNQNVKWLLIFVAAVAILVLTAASVPGPWHHDCADHECAVCYANQQPMFLAWFFLLLGLLTPSRKPVLVRISVHGYRSVTSRLAPRAPPAA